MEKTNKNREFLNYIKTPLSENSVAVLYSANNVSYEKSMLFSDFVQSLLTIVFDTYMGDDITPVEERPKHFEWCWKQNIKNFNEEGINFSDNKESYNYFFEFMNEVFYSIDDKNDKEHITTNIRVLWLFIFSYNNVKSRSDVDNFIEIYNILEKSLVRNNKK